jgi:hypothetical protein
VIDINLQDLQSVIVDHTVFIKTAVVKLRILVKLGRLAEAVYDLQILTRLQKTEEAFGDTLGKGFIRQTKVVDSKLVYVQHWEFNQVEVFKFFNKRGLLNRVLINEISSKVWRRWALNIQAKQSQNRLIKRNI